jgi:DUF1680 family protein
MSDSGHSEITRRDLGLLLAGASGAVATVLAQDNPQNPGQRPAPGNWSRPLVPQTPAFEGPLEYRRSGVEPKAVPFSMAEVRLLPNNVFHDSQEWNRGYMSRLRAERLLYNFRANAGLPVGSAKPLGGWEQPENGQRSSELRGHFVGHFLTATAQLAATGDNEAKAKGDYMVSEMAKCQEKLGGKYLSAFPTTWWDRLENGERVWAPFYTIHKIMAGMFDMYRLGGNKQALQVAEGMAAWADEWTASKTEEQIQNILNVEFGGIAETLYRLSAATDNDRWAKAGDRFQKKSFINPLAARRDDLRGLHANTHVPQAIAAAWRYEISADSRFRDVAEYFFYEVTSARSYVTGGTSNAEGWLAPPRRLAAELKQSVNTAECCCAYNMLKLARQIYAWNPDPAHFDFYERCLLNHRIGTIRPEVGYSQYYLSLAPGVWKTFNTEDQTFWCCTGSGIEEFSKLNDSVYWRNGEGLIVNLFVPSELNWTEKGLKVRQETNYPESPDVKITILEARPELLAIRLRIPGWLESTPTVRLNGKALDASAAPGSYLVLTRSWKPGDKVEMRLPMHVHSESMPDDPHIRAFLFGPLVLAGDLGNQGLTEAHIIGANLRVGAPIAQQYGSPLGPENKTPPVPEIAIPSFRDPRNKPSSWIKPADATLSFVTDGQAKNVTMVPLNRLYDRRYAVYWQVS